MDGDVLSLRILSSTSISWSGGQAQGVDVARVVQQLEEMGAAPPRLIS